MEHRTKQRLVGALVLLALGVVIAPTLLDFSQDSRHKVVAIKIPPAPDPSKMKTLPLENWSTKIDPEVKIENSIPVEAAPQPKVSAPEKKRPAPDIAPKKAPVVTTPASGWVVQIASFNSDEKARTLKKRLNNMGHNAFIVDAKNRRGEPLYRVRVGPESSQAKADSLKKRLKKEVQLTGLVLQAQ